MLGKRPLIHPQMVTTGALEEDLASQCIKVTYPCQWLFNPANTNACKIDQNIAFSMLEF